MDTPKPITPVITCAIDDVAYASLRSRHGRLVDDAPRCNVCNKVLTDAPAGSGLLLWTRGEEVHFDEPPLCANCAMAIGVAALSQWQLDESEE